MAQAGRSRARKRGKRAAETFLENALAHIWNSSGPSAQIVLSVEQATPFRLDATCSVPKIEVIAVQNILYFSGMPRLPKARQTVLDAARRIVETRGAGHMTFDLLAEESGVTRGGITYYFPTKELLLKALVEADIEDWQKSSEALGGSVDIDCSKARRIVGHVRVSLADQHDAHRRFVSGILSAAMVDPSLLDPVRAHMAREFADWTWDEQDLKRYLLLLATDGLFWNNLFNLSPLPADVRPRLVELIEKIVQELKPQPSSEMPVQADVQPPDRADSNAGAQTIDMP
jgi:AcrR family transcriptional regulator